MGHTAAVCCCDLSIGEISQLICKGGVSTIKWLTIMFGLGWIDCLGCRMTSFTHLFWGFSKKVMQVFD